MPVFDLVLRRGVENGNKLLNQSEITGLLSYSFFKFLSKFLSRETTEHGDGVVNNDNSPSVNCPAAKDFVFDLFCLNVVGGLNGGEDEDDIGEKIFVPIEPR